ncbi:PqqD family peptide modification chaperone [Evansella sp. AB-rgal1]|uniref:PqqD family peptide modification chaperone n=1 Tax=Evansella sp. AB-rgal1 TaxID=3242696 RepID=UPI00359DC5BC
MILNSTIYQSHFSQSQEVIMKLVEGKKVLVNLRTGKYYDFGELGMVIWDMLAQSVTMDHIVYSLSSEYEVSIHECKKNVELFLQELLSEGLVLETNDY